MWSGQGSTPERGVVLVAQGIVELLDICWFTVMPARASTASGFGWLRGTCVVGLPGSDVHEAHCWVLRQHAGVVSGVVFENCRVDASIFVVKLLRAHGGCLGFRSR